MEVSATAAWCESLPPGGSVLPSRARGSIRLPAGINTIIGPDEINVARLSAIGPAVPSDLLDLYRVVGDVDLPDIGNELSIHEPDAVADSML
jgi:hypothetical protein